MRAPHFLDYLDIPEVVEGVFVDPGRALHILDHEGVVASWTADEWGDDPEAATTAISAAVLAAVKTARAVRHNIERIEPPRDEIREAVDRDLRDPGHVTRRLTRNRAADLHFRATDDYNALTEIQRRQAIRGNRMTGSVAGEPPPDVIEGLIEAAGVIGRAFDFGPVIRSTPRETPNPYSNLLMESFYRDYNRLEERAIVDLNPAAQNEDEDPADGTLIENEGMFLDHIGALDRNSASSAIYNDWDCGPWIQFNDHGIRVGSVVEGCEVGTMVYPLNYPFTADSYEIRMRAISAEADVMWRWANGEDDGGDTDQDRGIDMPDISTDYAHLGQAGRSA
jgi:hypothetical protein